MSVTGPNRVYEWKPSYSLPRRFPGLTTILATTELGMFFMKRVLVPSISTVRQGV